jgi:regulator of protease activity HflC (stomatin/prohibitin superfamily)
MSPIGSEPSGASSSPSHDPYRGVVLVLLAVALLGVAAAMAAHGMLANPLLLDASATLGISAGILIGVALVQAARAEPAKGRAARAAAATAPDTTEQDPSIGAPAAGAGPAARRLPELPVLELVRLVRIGTGSAGALAILFLLDQKTTVAPTLLAAGIAAALCLAAAGLSATVARYLAGVDASRFPEAPALCRGARVTAWVSGAAALSFGLAWAGNTAIPQVLHFGVLAIDAAVCYGLIRTRKSGHPFPLDFAVLSVLGARPNLVASVLDSAEAQLGIDLRSTWALTVVRRSVEPLVIGLCFLGWLSTSLTVVGVEEQGLVERLGVPLAGEPLPAGLHLHLPWPVDRVFRVPVRRVQALAVGHEGEEGGGPENVLWAVEHAANEYTLLLGNGRDLITVDATVQFRIVDARAWRYHTQNPAEALKAIAYRAVMTNTVNRTLSDALSENVAALTSRMRAVVQSDADALGLGVQVMAFTVGGMHPPVMVAADYQGVVSAELGKVTAVVNAQVFRNETVPVAEAGVVTSINAARAEGAEALARAAGQAWGFRTLESQFRISPQDYYFRRRLETLEKGLGRRSFTVVDSRLQRDGGELWLTQ